MKVKGVSLPILNEIAYHLCFKLENVRTKGNYVFFALRMESTSAQNPNAPYRKRGFSGRRTSAVCFHGHKRFYEQIFARNPAAIIRTAKHSWLSLEQLENEANQVGNQNVGPAFDPQTYDSQCDC